MRLFILKSPRGIGSHLDSVVVVAKTHGQARRLAARETDDKSWLCTEHTTCNVVKLDEARVLKKVFMLA